MKERIRNFSIIAHVDHGKSTLADRLIEYCGGLDAREMTTQVLDSMELERERGITIKAQSVSLSYQSPNGQRYQLNLIDTPGHVDFSYEVSRSLSACQGALLVVDAAQGVEAQTVANCYTALEQGLVVLPVLNKIDLPQAEPERVKQEIEDIIGLSAACAVSVSAKHGIGIAELLEYIIHTIPAPEGLEEEPLQALIIDSWFDAYLGVVSLVCIKQGCLQLHQKIRVMSNEQEHIVTGLGIFTPKRVSCKALSVGQVGYVIAGIKAVNGAPVGDTLTVVENPASQALPGFKSVKPQVFAGIFPVDTTDFPALREALGKLRLNDASLFFEPENSQALGFGFRCGFLGLLHMEIVQERLEREYNLDLITTSPSVVYEVTTHQAEHLRVENPAALPSPNQIAKIFEPLCIAHILVPQAYVGEVITLCIEKRGIQTKMVYVGRQVSLSYELPMAEVIIDFFDKLKSTTKGYGSLDYQFSRFQEADLVRLDILINGEACDALATLLHRSQALYRGRALIDKLKDLIPRQMFDVPLQAALGGQIIARQTVKALRKNVIAKCYGGDITRKRKLLEKQKAGKKRMKKVGHVDIPQEAFLAVLRLT